MVFAHWPGFGCLCADSFPGMQSWAMSWWTSQGEVAHTDTTVHRAPGCHAVLYRTVVAGFPAGRQGPQGRDSQQAGTTRRSHEYEPAVGYPSRLTKGIMVISKYFLVSLQIVVNMVALSKLESRAKGTFKLECRRFANS